MWDRRIVLFLCLALAFLCFIGTGYAKVDVKIKLEKSNLGTIKKTHLPENGTVTINNGVISIDFGETHSGIWVWYYKGGSNVFWEEPYFGYGDNYPVTLSTATVYVTYPATGSPDVWYNAVMGLDLDGDNVKDVNITRSIMVPSSTKYFFVRYCIENIGESLDNFRVFQGVDYDAGNAGVGDEGGYNSSGDFVWTHDLDDGLGTYVGFKGNLPSTHHDVNHFSNMWGDVASGVLNDANYYAGDVGVALEWDLGTLNAGETKCLIIKYGFADTYDELRLMLIKSVPGMFIKPVPALSALTGIAMAAMLAGVALLGLKRKT